MTQVIEKFVKQAAPSTLTAADELRNLGNSGKNIWNAIRGSAQVGGILAGNALEGVKNTFMPSDLARAVTYQDPNKLQTEMYGDVSKILLAGLGLGATARGGLGLARLLNKNMVRQPARTLGPVVTPIPVHRRHEEDEEKQSLDMKWLTEGWSPNVKDDIPMYYPAVTMASLGGVGLGWTAIDKMLDSRRKAQQKAQIADAQQEFESALVNEKAAEDGILGETLNYLFDQLQPCESTKVAQEKQALVGAMLGAYLAAAGMAGTGSALLTYNMAKKQQRRALVAKAQKERAAKRDLASPSEIYAIPVDDGQ